MKSAKRKKLEAAGWQIGSASQLLGLSKQEAELVELRLALAHGLRLRREAQKLTQARLAKLIGSSQSRVAKMEAADSTVALDLLFRSLVATGATRRELAKIIQRPTSTARPNGWRVSGERRAEGDERVRCTRLLGRLPTVTSTRPYPRRRNSRQQESSVVPDLDPPDCLEQRFDGWLPSRLIPHRHRPRGELQPAHELQVDMLR
jgi:transcriptional regulator with XRE-family HTH domain